MVANVVPSVDPESEQGQGTDATESKDATAVAPSDPASTSATPAEDSLVAAEGANAPKKRHLLIPIPSRRSSKVNKQQELEKTEEAAQDEPPRRGSKVSILRSKRDQSRASSRRSRQTQDGTNAEESKETAASPHGSPSKPQQKKGPLKLLAFLGCCSSSDVDTDDAALPAKKTTMRPPTSNRLPTPDKAEAHTGGSSTAESREPYLDEKANSTVSADQPREEERHVQPTSAGVQDEGQADVTQAEASSQKDPVDDATPLVQTDPVPEEKTDTNNPDLKNLSTSTTEDPTPASSSTLPKTFGTDGTDGQDETTSQEEAAPSVVMPPPPPLPPAPPGPPARGYSEDAAHPLLPPPLPHLKGRKCLVLDLDETLVHSSFKVSICVFSPRRRRIIVSSHLPCI